MAKDIISKICKLRKTSDKQILDSLSPATKIILLYYSNFCILKKRGNIELANIIVKHYVKCENIIDKTKDFTIYDEDGLIYCIPNDKIIDNMNPYTGRFLTDDKSNECTQPNKKVSLKSSTVSWLKKYIKGDMMFLTIAYEIPKEIRMDLISARPCKPIKIWRGIHFGIDKYSDSINRKGDSKEINRNLSNLNVGDRYTYISNRISSWSTNVSQAIKFSQANYFGFVMEMTVDISDILFDTHTFPKNINDKLYNTVEYQDEVVILPKKYTVKIYYLNDMLTNANKGGSKYIDAFKRILKITFDPINNWRKYSCIEFNYRQTIELNNLSCYKSKRYFTTSADLLSVTFNNHNPEYNYPKWKINSNIVIPSQETKTYTFKTYDETIKFFKDNYTQIIETLA